MARWAGAAAALLGAIACRGDLVEKQEIKVPGWPDLSGRVPLSVGILSHDFVYASGMTGLDFSTMKPVPGGVQNETKQALANIQAILQAGGTDMAHVVGCAVYLQDIKDFAAMNAVYGDFFPKPRPVRVAFQVASLAGNSTVEIQCVASLPSVERREVVVPGWPDMSAKYPFSTGVAAGDFLYVSGMVGFDMATGKPAPGGIRNETAQAIDNIRQVLEAGGSSLADVVNCAVYLADFKDYVDMNEVYSQFFPRPFPSRVGMQVAALAGGASVEIQCSAALPSVGRTQVVVPSWPDMSGRFPFSSGIVAGGFLYASGVAGINMQNGTKVPGGVQAETTQALTSLQEVVEAGGTTMADVVGCAVYLSNIADFAAMNEIYATFFPKPPPARVAMQIAGLVQGGAVEIHCTAAMPVVAHPAAIVV